MRILGVDPGLRVTGYGMITSKSELIEAGVVRTDADAGIAERLRKIYQSLAEVIEEHRPDVLVVEKLYTHVSHPATAILMAHARGVVCLLSGTHKIPMQSVASTHIKKAMTGVGHAGKLQIQRMVQHTLGLKSLPEPPDVADALAVAIAFASSRSVIARSIATKQSRFPPQIAGGPADACVAGLRFARNDT